MQTANIQGSGYRAFTGNLNVEQSGGAENAGVENAGVDSRGGKCRSGKCGSRQQGWKTQPSPSSL